MKYKRTCYWDENRIKKWQINQLQKILHQAKNYVPYYSELFKKVGLDVNQVKKIKDLELIPFITRQDIIKNKEKFIARNYKNFHCKWFYTSGTTGSPLSFLLDRNAELSRVVSLLRCWSWAGYFPGMKTFSLQQGTSLGFSGVKMLPNQRTLKLSSTSLNIDTALQAHRWLLKFKPNFYIAYPYSLVNFIKYGIENLKQIHRPKIVISTGENLDDTMRNYIKSKLGCQVYDFYSHVESVIMGMEDIENNKYLMDDFGIHEIIDERTGKKASPGEIGLLIGTGLNNYSMPLIRYLVGDKIKLATPDPMKNTKIRFQQYEKLLGRNNEVICTPEGKKISILDDILHQKLEGIIASQLVQETIDTVKLRIIKGDHFNQKNLPKIIKEMNTLISPNMKYEFEFVDHLEVKKEGKIPFILSRLKKDIDKN